jgi:hypothetical protein
MPYAYYMPHPCHALDFIILKASYLVTRTSYDVPLYVVFFLLISFSYVQISSFALLYKTDLLCTSLRLRDLIL